MSNLDLQAPAPLPFLAMTGAFLLLAMAGALWRMRRRLHRATAGLQRRHRPSRALHIRMETHRLTLRAITDAVITTDAKGRVSHLNPAAQVLTGRPEARALGFSLDQVVDLQDAMGAPLPSPAVRTLHTRLPLHLKRGTRIQDDQGQKTLVSGTCSPVIDAHGQTLGTVLVLRDATPAESSQDRLFKADQAFRTMVHASPLPVCVLEKIRGTFHLVNAAFQRETGLSAEVVCGQDPEALGLVRTASPWLHRLEQLSHRRGPQRIRWRKPSVDGTPPTLTWTAATVCAIHHDNLPCLLVVLQPRAPMASRIHPPEPEPTPPPPAPSPAGLDPNAPGKPVDIHWALTAALAEARPNMSGSMGLRLHLDARHHRIHGHPEPIRHLFSLLTRQALQRLQGHGHLSIRTRTLNMEPHPLENGPAAIHEGAWLYVGIRDQQHGPAFRPGTSPQTVTAAFADAAWLPAREVVHHHGGHLFVDHLPDLMTTVRIYLPLPGDTAATAHAGPAIG